MHACQNAITCYLVWICRWPVVRASRLAPGHVPVSDRVTQRRRLRCRSAIQKEFCLKPANPLWKFFCSVKLTIVLLLSLAATSVIGTLIPQNEPPEAYFQAFGAFRYQLMNVLGLFDMYHAWWFQGLLLLLTINIVVCSIDRLQSTWKLIFNRNPKIQPERYTRRADALTHTDKRDVDQLVEIYEPLAAMP
jgi:cytochrome c biogenesis protein